MTSISLLVIIASFVALLVVGTEDMGSGHTVFANRSISGHGTFTNKGINVQTDTDQDQGCEGVGGTSGITNACTATSGPGSTETSTGTQAQISIQFGECGLGQRFSCINPEFCSGLGCTSISSISCTGNNPPGGTCTTNNGVQCTGTVLFNTFRCTGTVTTTHTVPGTGITQSGGVSG